MEPAPHWWKASALTTTPNLLLFFFHETWKIQDYKKHFRPLLENYFQTATIYSIKKCKNIFSFTLQTRNLKENLLMLGFSKHCSKRYNHIAFIGNQKYFFFLIGEQYEIMITQ